MGFGLSVLSLLSSCLGSHAVETSWVSDWYLLATVRLALYQVDFKPLSAELFPSLQGTIQSPSATESVAEPQWGEASTAATRSSGDSIHQDFLEFFYSGVKVPRLHCKPKLCGDVLLFLPGGKRIKAGVILRGMNGVFNTDFFPLATLSSYPIGQLCFPWLSSLH